MSVAFHISGLPEALTRQVRETLKSPGYGHPVMREVANGTGPCRACLNTFAIGQDERLLFTYRPPSNDGTLGAPGPVFIHAAECGRYVADGFPPGLRALPLFVEARASGNRILAGRAVRGERAEEVLEEMLADATVEFLHLRHGEAGCFITRVDRSATHHLE
jgi:hypothetical protein